MKKSYAKSLKEYDAPFEQVTDQSMRVLGGHPTKKKWIEAKNHLIHIEKADKLDPLINIAMGPTSALLLMV